METKLYMHSTLGGVAPASPTDRRALGTRLVPYLFEKATWALILIFWALIIFFTIFNHTFSVSLLSINKTKKKGHYIFMFSLEVGRGTRGRGQLIRGWAPINFFGVRVGAYLRWALGYSIKYGILFPWFCACSIQNKSSSLFLSLSMFRKCSFKNRRHFLVEPHQESYKKKVLKRV